MGQIITIQHICIEGREGAWEYKGVDKFFDAPVDRSCWGHSNLWVERIILTTSMLHRDNFDYIYVCFTDETFRWVETSK